MSSLFLGALQQLVHNQELPSRKMALQMLEDKELVSTKDMLNIASALRYQHFGRRVQIHIINNIRNGHCQEDCRYCAQRKNSNANTIPAYMYKSDEEILKEAKMAWESGAYRYCLVSAGRGPNRKALRRFGKLIREIKKRYPLEVCLSAGLVHDPQEAQVLADAGLDRYNHNLNSSARHYSKICTTHTYQDRINTLSTMQAVGIELCSGLIAGMGEKPEDLVELAFALQEYNVRSIPVNFFLPIHGHKVMDTSPLDADDSLRILSMLRLTNPRAEIRMAAGRELYLGQQQVEALAVANSLFVSGYLNVQGSSAADTIAMIQAAGYEIESSIAQQIQQEIAKRTDCDINNTNDGEIQMKDIEQLRPCRTKINQQPCKKSK